ncbi:MAG TPA: MFS transporter [Bdellovibrionales bacterium]|nr:MFS transporter [Bdellovibrionales bacterium]
MVETNKTFGLTRPQWAWAFYDFGNSAFATTVMAGFFPLFFKQYWAKNLNPTESTFMLGSANSLASFALVCIILWMGRWADETAKRKVFLAATTLVGALATLALSFVPSESPYIACLFYGMAALNFGLGLAFYDALLVDVSPPDSWDWVSGAGYALGYLGGGILFLINVIMTLQPQWFGFSSVAVAVKWSFASVAFWWVLFSLPLFKGVKEKSPEASEKDLQFKEIFKHLKTHKAMGWFLLAFLFYNDAVNTIVKMAVDYGSALGFESKDLIGALLMVQFIGFPAALAMGALGNRTGPLKGIYFCLFTYLIGSLLAQHMSQVLHFYLLAAMIGLVQGGVQSLSRSYFARFIPEGEGATYFGLFNLSGKFSAVLGPALMGLLAWSTGSNRLSMLVVIGFFFIGLLLLRKSQLRT